MIDDDDEYILKKAIGTEWYPHKGLKHEILKRKPKGSKSDKPIIRTDTFKSFSNIFNLPQVAEDEDDNDENGCRFNNFDFVHLLWPEDDIGEIAGFLLALDFLFSPHVIQSVNNFYVFDELYGAIQWRRQ
ncbi:nucleosome assembly protein 1;1-like [Nicotiana tabacum]|uniref:Nucleosome assembly protein 11-like n=1 Tax=Nicotiana tabacum TaxID=4097 RepID=A0AC58RPZ8_TOBAC